MNRSAIRCWPVGPAIALLLAGLCGCQTEVPALAVGGIIQGHIRYTGQAHRTFARPALQLAALALVPPPGRPHAALFLDRPDLSQPVPYQLSNLPPFHYKVVARLIDGDNPAQADNEIPTGSYPDYCSLVSLPEGNVFVSDAGPTSGIDITVYDNAGASDPCNGSAADDCPKEGAGTLNVTLELQRAPEMIKQPDQLVFVILTDKTAFPTRFKLLPAMQLASGFPFSVVINDVPPDGYLVYACYDVGGNNLKGCGPEDFPVWYMDSTKLSVEKGKITSIRLNLNDKSSALVGVEDPAAHGCK